MVVKITIPHCFQKVCQWALHHLNVLNPVSFFYTLLVGGEGGIHLDHDNCKYLLVLYLGKYLTKIRALFLYPLYFLL